MVTMFNQYWKYLFVTYIDCILKNRHICGELTHLWARENGGCEWPERT